jgi:hypothetical protein
MKSNYAASRTYSTRPETNPTPKEVRPESPFDRFLITFAGTDSVEASLWLGLTLLIVSGYCLALIAR